MDVGRCFGDADMGGDGAALLRQTGLVKHAGALAFQVPGHPQQRTNRDHAGAADAGDQNIPRLRQITAHLRCGQIGQQRGSVHFFALAQLAAMHGDEAGAEAFHARKIFIAIALVDTALAAVFGFFGQHRHAETFHPAIAAAFADQRIHQHALLRIHQLAALAAAAFFGGAGLVVNQDASALHFTQHFLHGIEVTTVVEGGALREERRIRPLVDVITDQRNGLHAFGTHLCGDLWHGQGAIDRLAAGHRDRVVVEDFVGDVDASGNRLTNGQRATVEVGAIAQVLEDMRGVGEWCLPGPCHAFTAHMGKGVGVAVHPRHHVVTANAALRAAAFRHLGAGVVRAAGAVMRHPWEVGARQCQLAFLAFDPAQYGVDLFAAMKALQATANHIGDGGWGQLASGRQNPFALLIVFADDGRAWAPAVWPVVELFFDLALDEGFLFLHHQNVFQPTRKRFNAARLQRPGHAHFIDANADIGAGGCIQTQVFQRLQYVQIALAGGDDAQPRRG